MSDDKPRRPGSNPNFPPALTREEETESRRAFIEEKLRAYLEDYEQEKAEGNTIANVRLELHQIRVTQAEQDNRIQSLELRADRHGLAIRQIKSRLDSHADIGGVTTTIRGFEHDTGVHQVEDLRRHLAEKEKQIEKHLHKQDSDAKFLRRQKIQWLSSAVGFAIASGVGGVATILWYLLTHGAK